MEKIVAFRLRNIDKSPGVIFESGNLLLYSVKVSKTIPGGVEEIKRCQRLRRRLGPVPLETVWRRAAGNKDFVTYTRAKNQLFEYQHAFWKEITTPVDSEN
ncbi:MAG TPA: hypothetical protein VJG66_03600 [Patescibacteria group bacterium]|nr:hypothetical protein [Patescibacteria group bacterium]